MYNADTVRQESTGTGSIVVSLAAKAGRFAHLEDQEIGPNDDLRIHVYLPRGTTWNAAVTAVGINASNIKVIPKNIRFSLIGPEFKEWSFAYYPTDAKGLDGKLWNRQPGIQGLPYLEIVPND